MNRICALCKQSSDMKNMLRVGQDFLCADYVDCYLRVMERGKLFNCPNCGSDNIHIEGSFDGAEPQFKGSTLSALKIASVGSMSLEAKCNGCETALIPTKDGYRTRK